MSPKTLFDQFATRFPIIANDTIEYKAIGGDCIEVKLKNRNRLQYKTDGGDQWSLNTIGRSQKRHSV